MFKLIINKFSSLLKNAKAEKVHKTSNNTMTQEYLDDIYNVLHFNINKLHLAIFLFAFL